MLLIKNIILFKAMAIKIISLEKQIENHYNLISQIFSNYSKSLNGKFSRGWSIRSCRYCRCDFQIYSSQKSRKQFFCMLSISLRENSIIYGISNEADFQMFWVLKMMKCFHIYSRDWKNWFSRCCKSSCRAGTYRCFSVPASFCLCTEISGW